MEHKIRRRKRTTTSISEPTLTTLVEEEAVDEVAEEFRKIDEALQANAEQIHKESVPQLTSLQQQNGMQTRQQKRSAAMLPPVNPPKRRKTTRSSRPKLIPSGRRELIAIHPDESKTVMADVTGITEGEIDQVLLLQQQEAAQTKRKSQK